MNILIRWKFLNQTQHVVDKRRFLKSPRLWLPNSKYSELVSISGKIEHIINSYQVEADRPQPLKIALPNDSKCYKYKNVFFHPFSSVADRKFDRLAQASILANGTNLVIQYKWNISDIQVEYDKVFFTRIASLVINPTYFSVLLIRTRSIGKIFYCQQNNKVRIFLYSFFGEEKFVDCDVNDLSFRQGAAAEPESSQFFWYQLYVKNETYFIWRRLYHNDELLRFYRLLKMIKKTVKPR